MAKRKTAVALVAAILIGAGVLAFVAYTTFDAIGFGTIVENGEPFAPTWGENQTITLRFSPESQPTVTFWNLTGGAVPEVNGTIPTTNITWSGGNTVYIYHWNWTAYDTPDCAPYGKDTAYLRVNYTGRGAAARAITGPAIILVAVVAIVVIAGIMVAGTRVMGGSSGGRGRKRFP